MASDQGPIMAGRHHKAILTVAVSSRALFHLERENEIFEGPGGAAGFNRYMLDREAEVLDPGSAFPLVRKLLALNADGHKRVDVVLLSRNSPYAGLRVMRSVREYGLNIERAVFCQGANRFQYASAIGADLFLSVNAADVETALRNGVAAAAMLPSKTGERDDDIDDSVRIAFDGDSVLFGSSGDEMYERDGMEAWCSFEVANARNPLEGGPFKAVLLKLHEVRASLPVAQQHRLRMALITARSAPAHERALLTLKSWGMEMDEAVFAAGMPKGPLARAFGADAFFDDAIRNVESANDCDIPSGHVPGMKGPTTAPADEPARSVAAIEDGTSA